MTIPVYGTIKDERGFTATALVIGIFVAAALFGTIYIAYRTKTAYFPAATERATNSNQSFITETSPAEESVPTVAPLVALAEVPADWSVFRGSLHQRWSYPPTWTAEEVTENQNPVLKSTLRFVRFRNPDRTLRLTFGLRKKGEIVRLSDRVRVGPGEFVAAGRTAVGPNDVTAYDLVDHDQATARFYYSVITNELLTTGDYEFQAEVFSEPPASGLAADLRTMPDLKIAETILSSFRFDPFFANWKKYEQAGWGFHFLYPGEWAVIEDTLPPVRTEATTADQRLIVGKAPGAELNTTPGMVVWLNRTAPPPVTSDAIWVLAKSPDGGFTVTKEEPRPGDRVKPNIYQIDAAEPTEVRPQFAFTFSERISAEEGFNDLVMKILSTFAFRASKNLPAQTWNWKREESVAYTALSGNLFKDISRATKTAKDLVPGGYTVVDGHSQYRLWMLEKEKELYIFDRESGEVRKSALPKLRDDAQKYETADVLVYSTDGGEALVEYRLFDRAKKKKDPSAKAETTKLFRYDLVEDVAVEAKGFDLRDSAGPVRWNRQGNLVYYQRGVERIDQPAILRKNTETGKTEESRSYKADDGEPPITAVYSPDGTKAAAVSDRTPPTVVLFDLPNLEPVKSIKLPNVKPRQPENAGLFDVAWTYDNTKLIVTVKDRVYLVDAAGGQETLIFSDTNRGSVNGKEYFSAPLIASTNGFLYLVDYDNSHQENLEPKDDRFILKAINLGTKEITVLYQDKSRIEVR